MSTLPSRLNGKIRSLLKPEKLKRLFTLGDLVLFSATNFVMTIAISRFFGPPALADFGIGLAIGLMVQSVMRNVYVIHNVVAGSRTLRRKRRGVIGEHLTLTYFNLAIVGFLGAVAYEFDIDLVGPAVVLSALYSILLYVQSDYDRYMLLSVGRHVAPMLLSMWNALALGVGLLAHFQYGADYLVFMAINIGFMLARTVISASLVEKPNFRWGLRFILADVKRRGTFAIAAVTSFAGYNQFPLIILAHYAEPIQVAAFVAMRGLVQPTQILLRLFDFNDKLSIWDKGGGTYEGLGDQVRSMFLRNVIFTVIVSVVYVLVGPALSHLAFGPVYDEFTLLMFGHALIFGTTALLLPIESLVNIMHWYRQNIVWRIAAGVVAVTIAFLFSADYGAWGALGASLVGWITVVLGGVWVTRSIIFKTRTGRIGPSRGERT